MSIQWLPSSFSSIWLFVREEISFKVFQDGRHIGYKNGTILAILNFPVAPILSIKCQLNPISVKCRLNNFKMAAMGHLGYLNETTLAILNFHVVPIPTIRFQLIRLSVLCKMSSKEFQDGRRLSWISIRNEFSNPESPCRFDTFYQVLAQSDFPFGRCRLKNFNRAASLDIETKWIEQFWISMSPRYLPSSFSLIWLSVWEISRWPPSWISKRNGLSNSVSPCRPDTANQLSAQSDFPFWRRCRLKNFKMATMISERNDFSNSKSTYFPNASYQVSVQFDFDFGGDVENVKS